MMLRTPKAGKIRAVASVKYSLLAPPRVREYILAMADKEWDPEDFVRHGQDLLRATWRLETAKVRNVRMRPDLMRSPAFQNELRPRIGHQLKLIKVGQPIHPLVLRGKDLLIFDGFARLPASLAAFTPSAPPRCAAAPPLC